jgi:ribosomal protein S18 acetylase RimI-like enzyme
MIRDFRPSDTPTLVRLMSTEFPAEEAIMGSHPDRFFKVVARVYRWDSRLILGLLRLFRRPVYRFLVVELDGRTVSTTLLTFPGPFVFISMVATDRSARRRGLARSLLEQARTIARDLGRQYLVLDVLTDNAPARALYEGKLGYLPLRETAFVVHDHPAAFGPERTTLPPGIRPYAKSDEAALLAIARSQLPPEVAKVLPRRSTGLAGGGIEGRIFTTERATWVVDRGHGPEAAIFALRAPDTDSASVGDPIVAATADPGLVAEMVRCAGAWCGARQALRIATEVPLANVTGRAALEREGFHGALSLWTLYRPVD